METHKKVVQLSSLALLIVMAGCGKGGDKEAAAPVGAPAQVASGDIVLLSMDGKPVMTLVAAQKEFEPFFERVLEQNGQAKMMAQLMPNFKDQLFENYCKGKVRQIVLNKYITEKGIDKKPEYKKQQKDIMEQVMQLVDAQFFKDGFPITVSESDIKAYYEEHKNEPPIMMSRGGVNASGVAFEKKADAEAFLAKAKGVADLKKLADKEGLGAKYHNFNVVNEQSMNLKPELRGNVLDWALDSAMQKAKIKFPATKLFELNDKSFFVVTATGKEDVKYLSLDEIKGDIEKYLVEKKTETELKNLEASYKINFNEEYFKAKQAAAAKDAEEAAPAGATEPAPAAKVGPASAA